MRVYHSKAALSMDAHVPAPRRSGTLASMASLALVSLHYPQLACARWARDGPWGKGPLTDRDRSAYGAPSKYFKHVYNKDNFVTEYTKNAVPRWDGTNSYNGISKGEFEAGKDNIELYSGLEAWEWSELGVYSMNMRADKLKSLTCKDVNWEDANRQGEPTISETGELIRCPVGSQYVVKVPSGYKNKEDPTSTTEHVLTRCVKFLYLNAFPGNRTNVFFNGQRLFNGDMPRGWHLSDPYEMPRGTVEVTAQLAGARTDWYGGGEGPIGTGKRWEPWHGVLGADGAGGRYIGTKGKGGEDNEGADFSSGHGYYTAAQGSSGSTDDDTLSVPGTNIMRSADQFGRNGHHGKRQGFQWQRTTQTRADHEYDSMYPFDDQGFFTYYMNMENAISEFSVDPKGSVFNYFNPTPSPSITLSPSVDQPSSMPLPMPTRMPLPSPTFEPTSLPTLTPASVPTTLSPSQIPSPAPTAVPVPQPTVQPSPIVPTTATPSMLPSPLPTLEPLRDIHPHVIAMSDGPYAQQWGFNQSKMDDLLDDGTVIFFLNSVMRNFTRIENFDKNCTSPGNRTDHIFYNRTFELNKADHAVVCVEKVVEDPEFTNKGWKTGRSERFAIANVSFMDLSMAYVKSGSPAEEFLDGWLTLHALPEIMPTAEPTVEPTTGSPTTAPTISPMPSAYPTPIPTPKPTADPTTAAPTTTTSSPTSTPMPTSYPDDGDIECSGQILAREKVYLEPGRIWYVGITGSFKEDQAWEEYFEDDDPSSSEMRKRDYGMPGNNPKKEGGEYGPWGGFYKIRGVDYKFEVIDEFGGPSQMPTTMPTFGDTSVYVPSEFISDPLKASYENFVISCILLFGAAISAFIVTRCVFNALEVRSKGRWLI